MPKPPRLLRVKQPPCMSSALRRRLRAASMRLRERRAISLTLRPVTSRTTGTSNPCSVSTAIPTWIASGSRMRPPSQRPASRGCWPRAPATTLAMMSVNEGTLDLSAASLNLLRKATSLVASHRQVSVTGAVFSRLVIILSAIVRRWAVMGTSSLDAAGALAETSAGAALIASTSRSRMRPPCPVGRRPSRST